MTASPHTHGATRIEGAVRRARGEGRMAVAAFLTAGFPDRDTFPAVLQRVRREADLVEVGVPFSDPMADGVTVQSASHRALAAGTTLQWIFDIVAAAPPSDTPLVFMSYLNPLLAFGPDTLAARAEEVGVSGFIVPDLPLEEADALKPSLDRHGLALVQLVSPVTTDERLRAVTAAGSGFVYAVTVTGTTGGEVRHLDPVRDYLQRVRAATDLPILAGFGIRTPEQVRALRGHADGIIVGSALLDALEAGRDPAAVVAELREASRTDPDD